MTPTKPPREPVADPLTRAAVETVAAGRYAATQHARGQQPPGRDRMRFLLDQEEAEIETIAAPQRRRYDDA